MSDAHMSEGHSTAPSCSCSNGAFIKEIDRESIIAIVVSARRKLLPSESDIHCALGPDAAVGSYNAVWLIEFNDGLQWVFRTPLSDWPPGQAFEKRFQSDIWAMQLIPSRISVPIPRIIEFSVSQDNAFGRPYTILARVKGVPLYELWFDPTWFTEEKRRAVFMSLPSTMSQLQALEFTQIGSIYCEQGNYVVGPLLPSLSDITNGYTDARELYNTVHSFRMDIIAFSNLDPGTKASLRMLAGSLPDERLDEPPFFLSMPDYDFHNVYIDNEGNVTGLLNWDDVVVGPGQAGYARYPLWIMRDIDLESHRFNFEIAVKDKIPFPPREEVQQDWPEFLPGYQAEFLDALKEVNPGSVTDCRQSHLIAPLIPEISSELHWGRIKHNLLDYMFLEFDNPTFRLLQPIIFQHGAQRGKWMKQFILWYRNRSKVHPGICTLSFISTDKFPVSLFI